MSFDSRKWNTIDDSGQLYREGIIELLLEKWEGVVGQFVIRTIEYARPK